MIIKRHVLSCLLFILTLSATTCKRDFRLSLWKDYHMNSPHLILSHSDQPACIEFLDRTQKEWEGEYRFGEELVHIQFKKSSHAIEVVGNADSLAVRGLVQGEKLALSHIDTSHYQVILKKLGTIKEEKIGLQGTVTVGGFDEFVLRPKGTDFGLQFQKQKQHVITQSEQTLSKFLSVYNINETYSSFGHAMLSRTFSQLCRETHEELSFIGICYNIHEGKRHTPFYKIDIRYSALIIDRLFGTYPKSGLFLFQELVGLLEDQIFYSDLDFVQIPQHISIVRGFVSATKGKTIGRLHNRVKQLVNGLMNQMLLAQVNSLQQQINYRENKVLHPTLVKMVSLKWHSHSRKNTLSSIYEESFTPDYFYNHANQRMDTCVSKVAWLSAATAEFVLLVKAIGNRDDLDGLDQSTSLFRILQQVSTSDNNAKQGKYYSINVADGVRIYAEQIGYESFLPFIYDLNSNFPEQFVKNITTPSGLASLNLNHDKFSSKFDFRGNVHLYFNYKILFEARRRLEGKNQRALSVIQDLISKVREQIIRNWESGRVFTSWTVRGEGHRERAGLCLLGLLVMGEKR